MGGPGSGRWPGWLGGSPCKETTEDYFALDVREVKRFGLIAPMAEEIPGVARLQWIPAGFGGEQGGYLRPWFLCPRAGCARRVAILYGWLPEDVRVPPEWACRTCRDLCYPVEREDRAQRALRKMLKARTRLGPGLTRPPRMRHATFVRLGLAYLKALEEYNDAGQERLSHMAEQMRKESIQWDRLKPSGSP